jgi:methylmalonyl-CoA mutase
VPDRSLITLRQRYNDAVQVALQRDSSSLLREWPVLLASITDEITEYQVRDKTIRVENYRESLSHQKVPKIAAPTYRSWGELLTFLGKENLPGTYPYTGGVYPYRRTGEDPIRMFAGEGTPERTNRRFHYLSQGLPAARLSTAFDSVTLYGEDPALRPDIYGKIGNSGVNVSHAGRHEEAVFGLRPVRAHHIRVDDDQRPGADHPRDVHEHRDRPAGGEIPARRPGALGCRAQPDRGTVRGQEASRVLRRAARGQRRPRPRPARHHRRSTAGAETYEKIKAETLSTVRGTVQADILKEDQAQNTCIFSTEFALRMMGDIQQYFVERKVRNFYSVSISGYHIAEAGANPISQLAFTLSNGFTIVEYYLARGMKIDDFAPNLSFFFSNGMDPEYTVIGRVARRIWARAMRERYGANAAAR